MARQAGASTRGDIHRRNAVAGNHGSGIAAVWAAGQEITLQEADHVKEHPPKDTAAEVDRVGEIDAAIVFGLASGRVYTPGGGLGKVKNGEGLAYINREQIDAIRQAVHELERAGYIVRVRERDSRGRLRGAEYTIYEQPQSVSALPALD